MVVLSDLFSPERVAVVGATDREGSVGRAIMANLLNHFTGEVIPVNPSRESVLGVECRPSLADAGAIDLVVIIVPPDAVAEVIDQAGGLGIEHVIIITAGFEEAGSTGATRAKELRELVDAYDLTVVGPNSLGVMSTPSGLNATFARRMADPGPISFMSQSGAIVTAVLDWARDQDIGFTHVVSLGNKLDVDEATLLEAWDEDPETDVIIGYLESIPDGRRFMEVASTVSAETPIVFIKAGRTEAGAQAASSHTGAMAGSDRVIDTAFAQSGVVRAETVADMFDAAEVLAGQPIPAGSGLGIVSNAGGPAVMATDAAASAGLDIANFEAETIEHLTDELPPTADPYNPVDVLGDADIDRFRTGLELVARDGNVDSLLVLSAPVATIEYADLATAIAEVHEEHGLPVVACLMGGREETADAEAHLRDHGIPNYFDPARAVSALGALEVYRQRQARPIPTPAERSVDRDVVEGVFDEARKGDRHLLGLEALEVLEAYGIDIPPGGLARNPHEAVDLARSLPGDRVVLKIVSPDLTHKTDVGGVRIGVEPADVHETYEDIISRARNYRGDASILGVYVQQQLDLDDAVEVIVGANRDPQFGPVILFGLGGIFVEVLEDVTVRVTPIDETAAIEMLDEIDAAEILRGARGRQPVDREAIADALLGIDRLVSDFPQILELDINPLIATPDGAVAIDLRMTLETT